MLVGFNSTGSTPHLLIVEVMMLELRRSSLLNAGQSSNAIDGEDV